MRIAVARAPERVEGVRAFAVFVAGDEVGVHETRIYEVPVRRVAWPAVEVSCDDNWWFLLRLIGDLRRSPDDELAAFPARPGAHVVEVRVQVKNGEFRSQDAE